MNMTNNIIMHIVDDKEQKTVACLIPNNIFFLQVKSNLFYFQKKIFFETIFFYAGRNCGISGFHAVARRNLNGRMDQFL